jgi:hypothetical protein
MKRAVALALVAAGCGGCGGALRLHAPEMSPSAPRPDAARIDFEPMGMRRGATVGQSSSGESIAPKPDAAAVLTAGMRSDLESRALHGGERGGYTVRCTLDRFAMRDESAMAGAERFATLYVDAACEIERSADHVLAWRGELRARAAAADGASPLSRDRGALQVLIDRMTADVTRELVSDLVVRVLGLETTASQRVFRDESERTRAGGVDDGPPGADALTGHANLEALQGAMHDDASHVRAAAWNAVAMASGPDETAELPTLDRDDDQLVRFFQYKALARRGTRAALAQLRTLASREDDALLAELARDALASEGLGLSRPTKNASAVTNGVTTSP